MRALIWAAVSTKVQANEDEKYSLTAQESDARTLCIQNDWAIVEVLSVPGHSRRYVDIHECAADMRQQGIDAFDRLLTLWDSSGFDVLIVRDGDRFARTQALHAYVTERTIDTGARIYSLSDGWIDRDNYRMWIAMSGYKAASDVDRLVKAHDAGMIKRAQRGLPAPAVPLSHRPLLDDRGKVIGIAVDESKRNLFDDLADLLLAGVSWHDIPGQLYERGHASPAGGYFGNATLTTRCSGAILPSNFTRRLDFWGESGPSTLPSRLPPVSRSFMIPIRQFTPVTEPKRSRLSCAAARTSKAGPIPTARCDSPAWCSAASAVIS